jgi:hypothetical protein
MESVLLVSLKAPEVGQDNRSRPTVRSVRSHMVADVQSEARLRVCGSAFDSIAHQHLPVLSSNISPAHSKDIMTDCELAIMLAEALDDFDDDGGRCSTSCSAIADGTIIHPSLVQPLALPSNRWFHNTQSSATDDRAHPSGDQADLAAATPTESQALYENELGVVGMAAIGLAPPALASSLIKNDTIISESLPGAGLTEGDTVRAAGPEPVPPALQWPVLMHALQAPLEHALLYSHAQCHPSMLTGSVGRWKRQPLQLVSMQLSLPSFYSTQLARSCLNSLGLLGAPAVLQTDVLWQLQLLQKRDVISSSPLHGSAQLRGFRVRAEHSMADQVRSEQNRAEQSRSGQSRAERRESDQTLYSTQLKRSFSNRRDSMTGYLNAEWGGWYHLLQWYQLLQWHQLLQWYQLLQQQLQLLQQQLQQQVMGQTLITLNSTQLYQPSPSHHHNLALRPVDQHMRAWLQCDGTFGSIDHIGSISSYEPYEPYQPPPSPLYEPYEPYQPPPSQHHNRALRPVDQHMRAWLQCDSWVTSARHVYAAASWIQAQARSYLMRQHAAVTHIQQCTRGWLMRSRYQCGWLYEPYQPPPPPHLNPALRPVDPHIRAWLLQCGSWVESPQHVYKAALLIQARSYGSIGYNGGVLGYHVQAQRLRDKHDDQSMLPEYMNHNHQSGHQSTLPDEGGHGGQLVLPETVQQDVLLALGTVASLVLDSVAPLVLDSVDSLVLDSVVSLVFSSVVSPMLDTVITSVLGSVAVSVLGTATSVQPHSTIFGHGGLAHASVLLVLNSLQASQLSCSQPKQLTGQAAQCLRGIHYGSGDWVTP